MASQKRNRFNRAAKELHSLYLPHWSPWVRGISRSRRVKDRYRLPLTSACHETQTTTAVENTIYIAQANAPANDDGTGSHGQSRLIALDGNIM